MATIVNQEMEQPRPSTSKGIIRLYSFFLLSAHLSSCCSSLFFFLASPLSNLIFFEFRIESWFYG